MSVSKARVISVSSEKNWKKWDLSDTLSVNGLSGRKKTAALVVESDRPRGASASPCRPKFELVPSYGPSYAARRVPKQLQSGWQALSIFSGCGGLDLGFLQEGIFSQLAVDVDEAALTTYRRNLSDVTQAADLSSFVPSGKTSDVLLAGAPCQGFSTVGKRHVHDPRNALLMRVADIAIANKTRVVVVENVPAAISGTHKSLWVNLEDRLRFAGYNVRRIILEGDRCGLAQRRKRLFLVCWIGSDCLNFHIKDAGAITLRHALAGLSPPKEEEVVWPNSEGKDARIIKHIKPGQKLSNVRLSPRAVPTWDIPEVFGFVSGPEKEILMAISRLRRRNRVRAYGDGDPVSIDRINKLLDRQVLWETRRLVQRGYLREVDGKFELTQTYNGRYRRLSWDEISPTVDTKFGRADLFVHPEEDRGFTAREAARIQGFPDDFLFSGKVKEKFTQIGNAVPPPMAAALAEFVREAILKG